MGRGGGGGGGGGVKMLTIYNILILMFEVFSTL